MVDSIPTIREPVLRELIEAAGGNISATVLGRDRGFALVAHMGNIDKMLAMMIILQTVVLIAEKK